MIARSLNPIVSMVLFASLSCPPTPPAQAPKKEGAQSTATVDDPLLLFEGRYIGRIFRTEIGEVPKIGWFVPEHRFVAPEEHADLVLYSAIGMPSSAKFSGVVTDGERKKMKHQFQIACETDERDRLTGYTLKPRVKPGQALFTAKKLLGKTFSGIVTVPLSRTQITEVQHILGWTKKRGLQRHRAVRVQADSFFYSFHKLYNIEFKALIEEAVVLHDKNGEILGHELLNELPANLCDGCGLPNYDEGESYAYRLMNIFILPGFKYPILLLNSNTIEGRALSLLTFTEELRADRFSTYEYVINCGQE